MKEDVFPIENGDCAMSSWFSGVYRVPVYQAIIIGVRC